MSGPPTAGFAFETLATDGDARRGRFTTPRATVETPAFMPVGTVGSVKAMTPSEVEDTGARMILANTYHLWLRPGPERVARFGGVGEFMAWPGAVLTDSGGYQVFSLGDLNRIDDDGVTFRSHLDGTAMRLTPEGSMEIQAALGSDVAMAFDECPRAMRTGGRWSGRSGARRPGRSGRSPRRRPRGRRASASCRAGCTWTSGGRTSRSWPRWTSTAWPWAASAWASRWRRWWSCSRSWPPRCRPTSRAT